MARRIRLEIAEAFYHVVNRGDRAELIFADDTDRLRFQDTLGEVVRKTAWEIHAFVLMPNHFHLLIRTPKPNLVYGMKWLLGTYTVRFNRRHGLRGHLFAGRYRAQLVSPSPAFLQAVADYIHSNPARAHLLTPGEGLRDYRWSSLRGYLGIEPPPPWLARDRLTPDLDPEAVTTLEASLEGMSGPDVPSNLDSIRNGWCFGEEDFRRSLLERVAAQADKHHAGNEIAQAAEVEGERIVEQALAHLNWSEQELISRPKGDANKLELAERLRRETTLSIRWIATRLSMGTPSHLSHLLYWKRRGTKPPKLGRSTSRKDAIQSNDPKAPPALPETTAPAAFAFDTSFD